MGQEVGEPTVKATYRKNEKIVYPREFLLSFVELESCKKRPEGLDCTILRDTSSSFGGPAGFSRGLIRRERESDGLSDSRQDVLEWRRSSNAGPLLQQGSRRSDSTGNTSAGNYVSRQSSNWGEGTHLRSNFERPSSQTQDPGIGQGRREHRYGTGDRERDRSRLSHAWDQHESDSIGHPSGISTSGGRQALLSHERDGLLGSGGGLRSYPGSILPAYTHTSDRHSGSGHRSRISEQCNHYQQIKSPTYSRHDRDSVNDETFGTEDVSSEERSEQERKRRESFQQMRKEHSRSLDSQNAACHRSDEACELDPSTLSSKEEKIVSWDDVHNFEPLLSSPSATPHSIRLQNEFGKAAPILNATATTTSLLSPSINPRPLVPPGFSKPVIQRPASSKGPTVEETGRTDAEMLAVLVRSEMSTEISPLEEKSSLSILDKLFVKASTVTDEKQLLPSTFILDETSGRETWNKQQQETSRFAQWFYSEEGKLQEVSAAGSMLQISSIHSEGPSASSLSNVGSACFKNNLQQAFSPVTNKSQELLAFSDFESQTMYSSPSSSSMVDLGSTTKELPSRSRSNDISSILALYSGSSDQGMTPHSIIEDPSCGLALFSEGGLALVSKRQTEVLSSDISTSASSNRNGDIETQHPSSYPLTADSLLGVSCKSHRVPGVSSSLQAEDVEFSMLQSQGHVLPMPVGPSLEDVEKGIHSTVIASTTSAVPKLEVTPRKMTHLKREDYLSNPEVERENLFQSEDFLQELLSKPQPMARASPVVVTCEDLEQSMLAKVSESPSKELVANSFPDSGDNVQDCNTDNKASQYILSLLHKGFSGNDSLESLNDRRSGGHCAEGEPLLRGESKPASSTQICEASAERKDCQSNEIETLEMMFGKTFMNELRSMEAPVSGKDFLSDSAASKEDGIQLLMNIMPSNQKLPPQLDNTMKAPIPSVGAIKDCHKRSELGNEGHVSASSLVRIDTKSGQDFVSASAARNIFWEYSARSFNEGENFSMGSRSISPSNPGKEVPRRADGSEGILNFEIGGSNQAAHGFFDPSDMLTLDKDGRTKTSGAGLLIERGKASGNFVGADFGYLTTRAQASSENVLADKFDTGEAFMKLFPKEYIVTPQGNSIAASQALKNLVEDRNFGNINDASSGDFLMNNKLKDMYHLGKINREFRRAHDVDGDRVLNSKSQYIPMPKGAASEEHFSHAFTSHAQLSRSEWSTCAPAPQHLPFMWQQQQQQQQQRALFPGVNLRVPVSHTQQQVGVHPMPFNYQQGEIQQNAIQHYEHVQSIPFINRAKMEPSRFTSSHLPDFPSGRSFGHEVVSSQLQFPLGNSQFTPQVLYPPVGPAGHLVPSANMPPRGFPFQSVQRLPFLHERANNVGIHGLHPGHAQPGMGIPTLEGSFNSMQGGFHRGKFAPVDGAYGPLSPFASDLKGHHRQDLI